MKEGEKGGGKKKYCLLCGSNSTFAFFDDVFDFSATLS